MLTGLFYLGADDISNGVVSFGRPVHKGTSADNMVGQVGDLVNGKYQLVDKKGNVVVSGSATDQILLNENGKIKLSGSVKDVNEDTVKLDSNGIVSTVNDVPVQ